MKQSNLILLEEAILKIRYIWVALGFIFILNSECLLSVFQCLMVDCSVWKVNIFQRSLLSFHCIGEGLITAWIILKSSI